MLPLGTCDRLSEDKIISKWLCRQYLTELLRSRQFRAMQKMGVGCGTPVKRVRFLYGQTGVPHLPSEPLSMQTRSQGPEVVKVDRKTSVINEVPKDF